MPRMTNGIGTWICTAHLDPGWGWDDAVECAMFLYLPVWPLRVVHLQMTPGASFTPDSYQAVPLRWSDNLVRHVFLRCWLSGCIGLGSLCGLLLCLHAISPPQGKVYVAREWAVLQPILLPLTPCLIVGGIMGRVFVYRSTRRERDIRVLLGVHHLGTSDPVTWLDEDLVRMPPAQAMFGTATYAAAVPQLMQAQAWTAAMWAARLTSARESGTTGKALTVEVLLHPGPREALQRYRLGGFRWREVMGVTALEEYQTQHSLVETRPPFQLALIEQRTISKATEQHDGYVAGVAAVCALLGTGLGAWLGSMMNIQVALLGAVAGAMIAAVGGAFLGNAIFCRR